ncbi:PAS-domain containing protein [Catenovulum sp. SM1970]|uniref:hybrid sensor histidine kinase/response regulator n=1 Tax=Marinifaba aquimaris TaxID=2741323 RepID=UPI0015716AA6|nr:PAS domain-containing hybrid sensor histidine kinase/response regulator [Marinifaba aquimaris]NTS76945.1 PAS-domain containing protein [Marinifaba aquimaris]
MTLLLVFVSLIYVAIMFFIAQWGDKQSARYLAQPEAVKKPLTHHPVIYSLALGIYCTSWTYFGAVGTAAQSGWQFFPILLGPLLLFVLAYPVIQKLVLVSKKQHTTSIADFISARYGKRPQTALIVTIIVSMAVIPYIALQLKAINASFTAFSVETEHFSLSNFKALIAICIIGVFAILYGARKADVTEYRAGLMLAIALESVLKILGLLVAAGLALFLINQNDQVSTQIATFNHNSEWQFASMLNFDFVVQTFMAAAAFLCLPRQFHVTVVDNPNPKHLKTARWLFPGYLLLTVLAIIPIALAGNTFFAGSNINQDTYIMQLPLMMDQTWVALLVFVGGLSAATAMIIVATLTLSTMLTNEVLMPFILKQQNRRNRQQYADSQSIIRLRRITIGVILSMAFAYYFLWTGQAALHSIGLIAFSLVIQLLPAIIGGLYWKRGHAYGVYAGLLLGFISWLMFLLMPLAFANEEANPTRIITQGVLISLTFNLLGYIGLSLFSRERLVDRIQATAFVEPNLPNEDQPHRGERTRAQVQDLADLLTTFLGEQRSKDLLAEFEQKQHEILDIQAKPSASFIRYCERALSGVLGSSSARSLVNVVLSRKQLELEEVVNFFDDTTQALKTNQEILFSSIESLSQGVSVIDADLNLVAWNKRYLEMFDYPEDMVKVGQPIASLIKFNAERGECGFGDINELVEKRLRYMQQAKRHHYIRQRSDGRVIEMIGNPLPNGGLVTSFNDITNHIETQKALEAANINLEKKVEDRKAEISDITSELKKAKLDAEQANQSKTRFLALASHDILQPLNAARLYMSAMDANSLDEKQQSLLEKTDLSLQATEELISTLLEIAKLEQGALTPNLTHFHLADLLKPLCAEYATLAEHNQLKFTQHWQDCIVYCDTTYLRRILQNFLSNAVKYTEQGSVLVGIRPAMLNHKPAIRIEVWDNGPGIAAEAQEKIFNEFYRVHTGSVTGVGLGLNVVQRMSQQLNCPIKFASRSGKGSCFGVTVPLGEKGKVTKRNKPAKADTNAFNGLRILCIDDDLSNLDSLSSLLEKWQCQVHCINSVDEALNYSETHDAPDIMIVDYQLSPSAVTGLDLIEQLRENWHKPIAAALVSAVKEPRLKQDAQDTGVTYIAKPVKPAVLKSWLKAKTF